MINWPSYAKNDDLKAVIDPLDRAGHKSRYINLLHHKVLANVIGDRLQGMSVLDLGCGIGRFNQFLELRGAKVIGVDSCQEMLDKNPGKTVNALVTNLPFPDSCFDAVLSVWTLQYLDSYQLETAVKEIARVLKPGGVVYLIEQMSEKGYDNVFERIPSIYWFKFISNGFTLTGDRPIVYAFDDTITAIRIGLIPEIFFDKVADVHLWSTKTLRFPKQNKKGGYIDFFMRFEKKRIPK